MRSAGKCLLNVFVAWSARINFRDSGEGPQVSSPRIKASGVPSVHTGADAKSFRRIWKIPFDEGADQIAHTNYVCTITILGEDSLQSVTNSPVIGSHRAHEANDQL